MAQVDVPAAFAIGSVLANAARQDLRQRRAAHYLRALLATNLFNIFSFSWISVYFSRELLRQGDDAHGPPARAAGAGADHLLSEVDCRGHDRPGRTDVHRPTRAAAATISSNMAYYDLRYGGTYRGAAIRGRGHGSTARLSGGAMGQHRTRGEPWDNIERS